MTAALRNTIHAKFLAAVAVALLAGCSTEGETEPQGDEVTETGEGALSAGRACAGPTGATCGTGEFCNGVAPGMCPGPLRAGVCAPVPRVCPLVVLPVCGCDGVTYDNPCLAARAGTAVAKAGACEPRPAACRSQLDCKDGQFCESPKGLCAAGGVCKTKPAACPAINAPVCGCDRKTYSNSCVAAQAGVSVSRDGICGIGPF